MERLERQQAARARVAEKDSGKRLRAAEVLQRIYQKEGRPINVHAAGDGGRTLELYSGLMMEGNYTYEAARRETVDCANCVEFYRVLGFREIVLKGDGFEQVYTLR